MPAYAPKNEAGEKPYIVWRGWSGTSQLVYGLNLRDALVRAYGTKGAKAGNGRRATPEDMQASESSEKER